MKAHVFYTRMPKKKKPYKRRGNPIFNFRLEKPRADKLREVSRIFGAVNPSVFVRELIGTIIGGTPDEIGSFLGRLQQALTNQIMEEMQRAASRHAVPEVPLLPKPRVLKGKGGRSAGRT